MNAIPNESIGAWSVRSMDDGKALLLKPIDVMTSKAGSGDHIKPRFTAVTQHCGHPTFGSAE